MTPQFKTIDEAIEFIKANYWDGLDYAPGRKDTLDKFSRETDLRTQYASATNESTAIFFFQNVGSILQIKSAWINPNVETA